VFSRADSLYFAGDFARAALEYERVIFRATSSNDVNAALFGRVRSFKQMQQFDKASSELLRVRLFTLNQEQMHDYFYEKILCHYLAGEFIEARGAVDEMFLNLPAAASNSDILLLQTLIYNELRQWDSAKQTALAYANSFPSPRKDSLETIINQLYAPKNLPKLKNESVSKVFALLSTSVGNKKNKKWLIYAYHRESGEKRFCLFCHS